MQELIFNVFPWETRAYVFDFGVLQNAFVEWSDEANVLGNIYEGRVDSISSNLGAAFLDIGAHKKAFLEFSNNPKVYSDDKRNSDFQKRSIRVGDRMPVQVISDISEFKALRVTREISLVGRYLVFRPIADIEPFNAKLRNQDPTFQIREKIRNFEFANAGFILRSAYDEASPNLVEKEAMILLETWEKIVAKRKESNFPGLLEQDLSLPLRTVRDFLKAFKRAGTRSQLKKRKYLKVEKKVEFTDGDRSISIEPHDNSLEIEFQLNYENKIIGKQKNVVNFSKNDLDDVINSRTFCLYSDIEKIKKNGLAKGGSLENAVVVDQDKVLNEGGLRNVKEFVNHKILDLAGDFLLSGYRILGKVKCHQGGHQLTNLFLRKIFTKNSILNLFEQNEIVISKKIKSNTLEKLAVNA